MVPIARAVASGDWKRVVAACGAQMGKALALDTPLPTPGGWTTMGEVQPGDTLFDERGLRCTVIGTSPVMEGHDCFRVEFSDGTSIVADADHLWTVRRVDKGRQALRTISTREIARSVTVETSRGRFRSKWAVAVARPLDADVADLPVPPYVLGVWLGDGSSNNAIIYCGNADLNETAAALRSEGVEIDAMRERTAWRLLMDRQRSGTSRRKHTMRSRLSALGVIGKKHIPPAYLRASVEQRLSLLQGLMDTDGHVTALGSCEFTAVNGDLAVGVMELVRSLGLKPVLTSKMARIRGHAVGIAWRVRFTAYAGLPVFRLARKRDRQREPRRPTEAGSRFITAVVPVESVPVKCLAIDAPSHLYLAGEGMVPTHNTDTELDIIGHRLDQKPAPILFVGPNKQFLNEQFEPRLMALLDEAPVLKRKVARGKRMTKTRKVVAGVPVRLAHAGSSTALKSDPAALAIVDEYDEMLANVKGQGDPLGLVEVRGDTYADFTTVVTSTPSVGAADIEVDRESGLHFWKPMLPDEVESAIWKLWQQGTRHHWCWQCPHCDGWFVPRFSLLHWPEKATPFEARSSTYMLCPLPNCGGIIEDRHKARMNERGQYVAPGQTIDRHGNVHGDLPETSSISFWVSGLASPFVSFGERVERFLMAVRSGDREKTQTAINAGFGELWAPAGGDAPDVAEIHRLRVPYRMGDVPDGVRVLTIGVDVQKNRLVYVIRGWGARGTSWLIQYGSLYGNTAEPEVWTDLDDLLEETWGGLRIRLAVIDSGFRPNKRDSGPEHIVYEFCRRHQRTTRPSKGYESLTAPVILSKIEVSPSGGKAKYGLELARINSDWCKLWVHERIRWPQDQPGAFFLPEDVPDEYCQALVSEARVKKPSGRATWVQRSRNNHGLDCEAMAYVAGYLLNVHRIPDDGRRRVAAEEAPDSTTEQDPPSRPPPAARQRVIRSNYLGR